MPKMTRRSFLWIAGGTGVALAADPPRKLINKLIPQVIPPEHIEPGQWARLATTCRECPAGCGMHLWHRDGRVTKAEGNPDHPVNAGGLCPRGQSSVQGLYDPDRVRGVLHRRRGKREAESRSWDEALADIAGRMAAGGRVAILSGLETGALAEVMAQFAAEFGQNRLLLYEPFNYEPLRAAHRNLFGLPVIPGYRIDRCNLVLSFAADFLETWVSPVSHAVQYAAMHGYRGTSHMNRMVYIGPRLSMTAANADDFIQVPPGWERVVALALVKIIIDRRWARSDLSAVQAAVDRAVAAAGPIPGVEGRTLEELARSFVTAEGSVALAGPVGAEGPAAGQTATAAALLNLAAGRIGQTVDFARPHALGATAMRGELDRFLASLGPADVLFVHGANPLYSRPDAAAPLQRVGLLVCLGTLSDETAEVADWFLPVDSPLESWGDYEPEAGIHCLMQPTMERLHDSRAAGDVFLQLARRLGRPLAPEGAGAAPPDFPTWLRERWYRLGRDLAPRSSPERFWTDALVRGGAWRTGSRKGAIPPLQPAAAAALAATLPAVPPGEVALWPWASILHFDGRQANRGWLQEAPDPVTFIAWGNWIDLHPRTAAALELSPGDVAELETAGGTLTAGVRVTDEVTEGMAAIAFGHGHRAMGRHARGTGANVFPLLASPHSAATFAVCHVRRGKERDPLGITCTAPTREQFDRGLLQWVNLSRLARETGEGEELALPLPEGYRPERDLYPRREYKAHRWAMVIDLHRCIGCGACAVACYAENNVAVMGKEQVGKQREMAWLRVVPYRKGEGGLRYGWLPMLCQHCDAAPCEPVCPVFAAVHNEEGLNAQIYNRCIGTRYCSNNCPYKVRRFNWLNVAWEQPLDLQLNPEVTVRSRGVMEKCTFCVQRIRQAEYRARREHRAIRDGEIQPACAQSCPTRAFTFGDLLDPEAQVTRLTRSDPRRYQVLGGLNTKPAVTYLRRVENDR